MNKIQFIISIFVLLQGFRTSIVWTPNELAKYINENYVLGSTFLFDENSDIQKYHREKINDIMYMITELNDVFVYGIILGEVNLNNYDFDVFIEQFIEALTVPDYVDKNKLIVISVAFVNKRFALRVGEIENIHLNNQKAAKILQAGTSYLRYDRSKGIFKIFLSLRTFYFPSPMLITFPFVLIWFFVFSFVGLWFRLKYRDIIGMPFFLYTKEEREQFEIYSQFFKALRDDPNIIDTHCLICFKPLRENDNTQETTNGIEYKLISDKNIIVCDFKHALHYECLQRWQKASKSNECPICLEEISRTDLINDATSLKEKLFAIQYDFYPKVETFYHLTNNVHWTKWASAYETNENIKYKIPKLKEIKEQRRIEEEEEKRKKEEERRKKEEERKAEEERKKNFKNLDAILEIYDACYHQNNRHPQRKPASKKNKPKTKYGGFGGKKSGGAHGGW